jgi:hypothetical protein
MLFSCRTHKHSLKLNAPQTKSGLERKPGFPESKSSALDCQLSRARRKIEYIADCQRPPLTGLTIRAGVESRNSRSATASQVAIGRKCKDGSSSTLLNFGPSKAPDLRSTRQSSVNNSVQFRSRYSAWSSGPANDKFTCPLKPTLIFSPLS